MERCLPHMRRTSAIRFFPSGLATEQVPELQVFRVDGSPWQIGEFWKFGAARSGSLQSQSAPCQPVSRSRGMARLPANCSKDITSPKRDRCRRRRCSPSTRKLYAQRGLQPHLCRDGHPATKVLRYRSLDHQLVLGSPPFSKLCSNFRLCAACWLGTDISEQSQDCRSMSLRIAGGFYVGLMRS